MRDRLSEAPREVAADSLVQKVAIGLIGYYPFIRGYPLGPELKARLERHDWAAQQVAIKEMNWGPIAIVQDFQASGEVFDRIVLVAAVDRDLPVGSVTARRWVGGELDVLAVQGRIFEAVTGIVSLDNLLVIGGHFHIWPREVVTVEMQLPDNCIGELILAELDTHRETGEVNVVGDRPLAPEAEAMLAKAIELVRRAVTHGPAGMAGLAALSAEDLNPLAAVCHNQLIADCPPRGPAH